VDWFIVVVDDEVTMKILLHMSSIECSLLLAMIIMMMMMIGAIFADLTFQNSQ